MADMDTHSAIDTVLLKIKSLHKRLKDDFQERYVSSEYFREDLSEMCEGEGLRMQKFTFRKTLYGIIGSNASERI